MSPLRDRRTIVRKYVAFVAPSQLPRLILSLVLICTLILAPWGLVQLFRAFRNQPSARRVRMIKAARRSTPIMVHVLMANEVLYREAGAISAALVLGSFDPAFDQDPKAVADLAIRVSMMGFGDTKTPDEELVERMMADEEYQEGRRRPLPESITAGKLVYLFDFQVVGDFILGQA